MTTPFVLCTFAGAALSSYAFLVSISKRKKGFLRLANLRSSSTEEQDIDWEKYSKLLESLSGRFGDSGLVTPSQVKYVKMFFFLLLAASISLPLLMFSITSLLGITISILVGSYVALCLWLLLLKTLTTKHQRKILFSLPIALESLILLSEAGLGLLPAIEKVVSSKRSIERSNEDPVIHILKITYELAASGVALHKAFELVANAVSNKHIKHVLLHLEMACVDGGEVVPALRSLSSHCHIVWKLAVEERVKKLENFVVFPVFVSVIGLMFLTSAVPMIPLLELRDTLKNKEIITLGK